MKFKKSNLVIVRNALQYAVVNAKSEQESAEFALLLLDVETSIIEEAEKEKRLEKLKSLEGCIFKYCAYSPKCEGKCGNV